MGKWSYYKRQKFAKAMKKQWKKMGPEDRKRRIKAMQAGRKNGGVKAPKTTKRLKLTKKELAEFLFELIDCAKELYEVK